LIKVRDSYNKLKSKEGVDGVSGVIKGILIKIRLWNTHSRRYPCDGEGRGGRKERRGLGRSRNQRTIRESEGAGLGKKVSSLFRALHYHSSHRAIRSKTSSNISKSRLGFGYTRLLHFFT
jgi:hypothetical protein